MWSPLGKSKTGNLQEPLEDEATEVRTEKRNDNSIVKSNFVVTTQMSMTTAAAPNGNGVTKQKPPFPASARITQTIPAAHGNGTAKPPAPSTNQTSFTTNTVTSGPKPSLHPMVVLPTD